MARGSICKRQVADGSARYDAIVDLGIDPATGRRRQRKQTFKTKKEAQGALTVWQAEVEKGTAVDRSRQTMADMLRYWLDTYARHNVSARSFEDYERIIEGHVIPLLGPVPAQKLTPDQLQAFYSAKLAAGCGPRTVQLCHLRIAQALKQAVRLGLVARNVADVVTPPRVQRREMQTWTADQARQFLHAAADSSYGPIWIVALATGMRRGELLGLCWRDVDLALGVVSVRQTVGVLKNGIVVNPPKTTHSRRDIAIQGAVVAALREYKAAQNERRLTLGAAWEDHDLVFAAASGGPIHPGNLKRDYNRCVVRAGVPRIRIHDLRHTSVTLALAAGAHVGAVSRRVGHARTSITMDIYAHVLPEMHADVADKLDRALFGAPAQGVV